MLGFQLRSKVTKCIDQFECKPSGKYFLYDCYYDPKDQNCRCYTGSPEKCTAAQPAAALPALEENATAPARPEGISKGRLAVIAVGLLAVIVLLLLALRSKPEEETGEGEGVAEERGAMEQEADFEPDGRELQEEAAQEADEDALLAEEEAEEERAAAKAAEKKKPKRGRKKKNGFMKRFRDFFFEE